MGQLDGHCLCGNVSYTCESDVYAQLMCHCSDCQHQTGTTFSVVVGVARAAFKVEGDSLATYTTIGEDTKGAVHRQFCSACGSPIASLPDVTPDLAFIKAGTLNDTSWLEPEMEIWCRSAQKWVTFDGENRGQFERSLPT